VFLADVAFSTKLLSHMGVTFTRVLGKKEIFFFFGKTLDKNGAMWYYVKIRAEIGAPKSNPLVQD
jgi:hypothetical protein